MKDQRQTKRIYNPKSVAFKARDKQYKIHNISEEAIGFFVEDPSTFHVGETLTSITLEFDDGSIILDGEVIHMTLISSLLSNLPSQNDVYVWCIAFIFRDKDTKESLKRFMSSQKTDH